MLCHVAWRAGLAGLAIVIGASAALGVTRASDWQTIESPEYGFMIAYPGSIFAPDTTRPQGDSGHVLVSRDGRARLLVGTFENDTNASLEEYRRQLIDENWPDAEIEYAPIRGRWFVLSGTQDDRHFYYRVSFTCGGRLINSWALIYPAAERRLYDRVVEKVARSYTPGAGRTGSCD